MPRYEFMYLLGSNVADSEVPEISGQILKTTEDLGGSSIIENQLGKKKLAYPIKKTRNGHYVVVNFTMETDKVNELAGKIRTMSSQIIRHLIVNLEEHLQRTEKDKVEQAKIARTQRAKKIEAQTKEQKAAPVLAEIDQAELDKKIEEALTEDITK